MAESGKSSSCCVSFQSFGAEMRKVFDHASTPHDIARWIYAPKQENRKVTEYSIEFRTLAALYQAFYAGLAEGMKDQ